MMMMGNDKRDKRRKVKCAGDRAVLGLFYFLPLHSMSFAPKPGCPMCGIVNTAFHSQINSPSFNPTPQSNKPDILWKDDNFTVYRETANPVSSIAHVILAFKSV